MRSAGRTWKSISLREEGSIYHIGNEHVRAVIIHPWQVKEFIEWLSPDVSAWAINDLRLPESHLADAARTKLRVAEALSRYDSLKWFEDGKLVGDKNNESREITQAFKDYRFNGLFYSGLFDTEGEPEWK